jgi:hypothetical protein
MSQGCGLNRNVTSMLEAPSLAHFGNFAEGPWFYRIDRGGPVSV